jgi:hypothetical protein
MIEIINELQKDLDSICDKYIFQPVDDELLDCMQEDCNIALDKVNASLAEFDVKAILSDFKYDNGNIDASIDFIDLETGNEITSMEQLLNKQ